MVCLIGYDLNKPAKEYNDVYAAIKASSVDGTTWWHFLDSTWIIKSDLTVDDIYSNIKPNIDNNDNLLVIEVKNNKQGWLPKNAWDYLNDTIFF